MKRKNCVAGQCVQVKKKEQTNGWFQARYRGQFGIIKYLDDDGDVHVEFGMVLKIGVSLMNLRR
ncbi:DNA-binding protein [Acinetobacter phage ABp57]|nr:DNA-binding protein [Acinetobacter phage ABp57]